MRQGQQNRRGRGRNRKSQNPLTRSFESTGPDVKLRGTPSHIAEKYMSLARDALSSGDPVLAENYMQHAEHYNRIIMSFREQQISQGGGDPLAGGMRAPGAEGFEGGDEFGDEDGEDFGDTRMGGGSQPDMPQPQMHQPRNFDQPQQRFDNRNQNQHRRDNRDHQRRDNRFDRGDRGERHDRQDFRSDRQERNDRQDFRGERQDRDRNMDRGGDRGDRGDRQQADRGDRAPMDRAPVDRQPVDRPPMEPRPAREERPQPQAGAPEGTEAAPRRRERFQSDSAESAPQHHQQPEFLRRPVRRQRAEPAEDAAPPVRQPAAEDQD